MNNNRAFSLIEVIIVIVIIGILAAVAVVKFQKSMATTELDKAATGLFLELRGLRAISYKYDDTIKVVFNPTATPPQCTVKVYASDAAPPGYQTIKIHKIAPPIAMGYAFTGAPSEQPYTDAYWSGCGQPVNGIQGDWKTRFHVNPNTRAQYDQGGVYLNHPRLGKTTYFVGISWRMQSIELKRWNGTSWDNL